MNMIDPLAALDEEPKIDPLADLDVEPVTTVEGQISVNDIVILREFDKIQWKVLTLYTTGGGKIPMCQMSIVDVPEAHAWVPVRDIVKVLSEVMAPA